jgi:EAL domain-containing protein (putative c-di-GMP-specific phosphodiesterase class I)
MTQAVITLAHTLGMRVIAAGVETPGQLMPGYYFSRPLAPEEIVRMRHGGKRLEFNG